ncbi:MAG: PCMD domain-containing protein [Bacteroidetes bacterium]|nr:PCMD domain-containing protein [Bacteroidota bacterium]
MKKVLLSLAIFAAVSTQAQIVNNDFENWAIDTIFSPPISTIPADTFTANNPVDWTSSNSLTGTDSLGGVFFVTQSSDAYSGSSALKMVTDTLRIPLIPGAPSSKLTIPGFAVNGKVPITANTLLTSGSTISPMSILGAGQPFNQRLSSMNGYYKYAPQLNGGGTIADTCLVWAALRKGTTLVGQAVFKSTGNTNGNYVSFNQPFEYFTCDLPDTLVILVASSVPNIAAILSGNSGLVAGSEFILDSLSYTTLPGNYNFPPITVADQDTTTKNVAKTVLVKLNDDDCNDPIANVNIQIQQAPSHGTATVVGTTGILYTPANNYVGLDTFYYTLNDGVNVSIATRVRMLVLDNTGVEENGQVAVALYPQPTGDVLNIQFENTGKSTIRVFDMIGNLVLENNLTGNTNALSVKTLGNGVYGFQLVSESGLVLARNKFVVSK